MQLFFVNLQTKTQTMYSTDADRLTALNSLIEEAGKIAVVTHARPDGDAAGSTSALCAYLEGCRGKDCRVVLSSSFSETLTFVFGKEPVRFDLSPDEAVAAVSSADLIFCLDCSSLSRTESLQDTVKASAAPKVLIDHHKNPLTEEFSLVFSDTEVSSTCELLFSILLALPDIAGDASSLPEAALTGLMTGLTTDTNNFANSVFPNTLRMASDLIAAGTDRDSVLDHVYNSYRENRLRLMGHLLDNMVICDNGLAYIIFSRQDQIEYDYREGEAEGFVNLPLAVRKVKMSILLTEDDGFYRVSIRSKKGTSARECAASHFHGGGHEQASGGRLYWPDDIASPDAAGTYVKENTSAFL